MSEQVPPANQYRSLNGSLEDAMVDHLPTTLTAQYPAHASHLSSLSYTLVSLPQTLAASSSLLTKTLAGRTFQTLAACSDNHEIRPPPLNFPRFNGQYPLLWIFQAQQFFDHHQTANDQRLCISSFYMDGDALSWYNDHAEFKDWSTFTRALASCFGPSELADTQGALAVKFTAGSHSNPPELLPLPLVVECTPAARENSSQRSAQRDCLPIVCGKSSVTFIHSFIENQIDSRMPTVEFETMSSVKGLDHAFVTDFAKFEHSLGKAQLLGACAQYSNVHFMYACEPEGSEAIELLVAGLFTRDDCIVVFDPGILRHKKLLVQDNDSIEEGDVALPYPTLHVVPILLCSCFLNGATLALYSGSPLGHIALAKLFKMQL